MPATTTATELQRNYTKVLKKAKKLKKPVIVLSNNKAEGVYMDYETYRNGYKLKSKSKKKGDLSRFSGVWTKKEADEFNKIIEEEFERTDPEDWK